MKPLQIAALVVAGALGGAIVMKTVQRPAEVAQAPVLQPETAAAPQQPPAEPSAPIRLPSVATPPAPESAEKSSPIVQEVRPTTVRHAAPQQHAAVRRQAPPPDRPVVVRVQTPPAAEIPVPPAQPEVQAAPEPRPAPPVAPPPQAAPPVRAESENVTPTPLPPPPPAPRKVTLNAGTLIPVRLVDGLSSERNAVGDSFTGTLNKELVVDGLVIAERGARVEGRVVSADRGGKVRGLSSLAVELTRIHTSDGQNVAIETDTFERHSEPNHNQDVAKVGGGAAVGAIIGAIAGGGKGAAIGAGVGGAAGAGDVLLTRGRPATLPSETRLNFRLRTPVTLTEHTQRF